MYAGKPMAAPFSVLVMAAGHGTRMRSRTPKVLHRVCGKPMIEWVIDAARDAGAEVREGAAVEGLLRDGDGRVTGVHGAGGLRERARSP